MTLRALGLRAELPFAFARTARPSYATASRLHPRWLDGVCLAITCLLASALWCVVANRTSWAAWQVPPAYGSDALEVLAHLKAASEWAVVPTLPDHVTRLGAPFGAEWSEYPAADDVLLLLAGQLSRAVGLGVASNLLVLFAQASAAGAFFVVCRWLGQRREWAMGAALLFAFSYHNVTRGFAHLSLILTYTVPLCLLACWLVAKSRRLTWNSPGAWLCWATAIAVGIGNPYNLFLFVQLLGWALVASWATRGERINRQIGALTFGLAIASFVIVNADVWLAATGENAAPLMARNYGGVEHYALKPIELLVPPVSHRVAALAFWGHRYTRWSDWQGEPFSPYLGIFGGLGFLGMLFSGAIALLRGQARRAGAAAQSIWILLFSAVGGINSILALFLGVQIFRGTNRYSVFLLALGLIFLASLASRRLRALPRTVSVLLAVLVAATGLWEEIPRADSLGNPPAAAARFANDRSFGSAMESTLPAHSLVFQLPFLEFPEARPVNRLEDYELFRPYLHTSTLRFTYGALKQRSRSRWYREYAALPPPELIAKLEASGFAAIYINRRGYADNADQLLTALTSAGRPPLLYSPTRQQVLVRLHPAAHPTPPLATNFTFGQGWNNRTDNRTSVRWAYGPASLSYFNPSPRPISAHIDFRLSAEEPRHLEVTANGSAVAALVIDRNVAALELPTVILQPGINRFDLSTAEPPVRGSEERSHLRAFALHSATLQIEAAPATAAVATTTALAPEPF